MSRKAGLDSAIDFTKFVITIDTALIAFLTGAAFLDRLAGGVEKAITLLALLLLAVSVGAGVLTQMRAANMLENGSYHLADRHLRTPGAVNVVAFAAAAAVVGVLAAYVLMFKPPPAKGPPSPVTVVCLPHRPHAAMTHGAAQRAPVTRVPQSLVSVGSVAAFGVSVTTS